MARCSDRGKSPLCMLVSSLMELRLSVRMLKSSSPGQPSNANHISVSSGRSDDGWPKTTTLCADLLQSLATSAASILQTLLREPSVATTIPLLAYAVPACPSNASSEEEHTRSKGTPSSADRRMDSMESALRFKDCFIPRALLAQRIQSSCSGSRSDFLT
jgi:hypothetical protein